MSDGGDRKRGISFTAQGRSTQRPLNVERPGADRRGGERRRLPWRLHEIRQGRDLCRRMDCQGAVVGNSPTGAGHDHTVKTRVSRGHSGPGEACIDFARQQQAVEPPGELEWSRSPRSGAEQRGCAGADRQIADGAGGRGNEECEHSGVGDGPTVIGDFDGVQSCVRSPHHGQGEYAVCSSGNQLAILAPANADRAEPAGDRGVPRERRAGAEELIPQRSRGQRSGDGDVGEVGGAVPRPGGHEAVESSLVGTQRRNGERRVRRSGQRRTVLEPLPAQRAVAEGFSREDDQRARAIGPVAGRREDGVGFQRERGAVGHRIGGASDFDGVEALVQTLGVGDGEGGIGLAGQGQAVFSPTDDKRPGAADGGGEGGRSARAGKLVRQRIDPERHVAGLDDKGVEQLGRDERAAVHPHGLLHGQVGHGHSDRAAAEDALEHGRPIVILRVADLEGLAVGQQFRDVDIHRVKQVPVVDGEVRALGVVAVGAAQRPRTGGRGIGLEARRIGGGVGLPGAEGLCVIAVDEGRAVAAVVPVVIPERIRELAEGPRIDEILSQPEDHVVREQDLAVVLRGEHRVAAYQQVVRDHQVLVVGLRAVAQQHVRAEGMQRMKRRVARQTDAGGRRIAADEDVREHPGLRTPTAALEDEVPLDVVAADLPGLRVDVHAEAEAVGDDVIVNALGACGVLRIDGMACSLARLLPADVVNEAAVNL